MGRLPPTEPEQEAEKGRDPSGGTRAQAETRAGGQRVERAGPAAAPRDCPAGTAGTLAPTSHGKEGEGDRNQEASLPAVAAPRSVGAVLVKG